MNYQNIHVNGNRMEPNRIYAGTRGSYITDVSFSFSGEWEGLTKKLIFYPVRGTPVYTVYTYGTVRIPARVMRNAGISVMLISGYRVTEDGKIGEKIITASASVLVESAESDIRNEPDIPEATVFEDIVAKLGAPYIGESGNWYIWDVDTHEFVDTGLPARGEKGETGRGLTILGKYSSLDELRAAVKDAQPGDAYAVGEKAPYTIYIWDEVTGDFTDHGDMRGVGITKIEQITDNIGSGEPNTIRIYTDDGEEYDYTVYNGERGQPGNIWIGETEPPDDSYVIWLNPSGVVSGFVASYQGTENAGKAMVVGEDGTVVPGEAKGNVELDTTLTQSGKAADAKAVGDALAALSGTNSELPFTENEISGVASGGGFVVNPTNFADGKTYFRYNAGATYGFRWTNPNPQKGSLTITMRGYSQYSTTLSTAIVIVYTDGTDNALTGQMRLRHGETVTYTTDPNKTVDYIRGNYDFENWVLLDMDALSIVADYPAPTGTVKSVNGILPDENGNVEIPVSGGTLVEPAEDDIPKVFFGGALQQTKDEAVVPFRYISKTEDVSGYAEIKAQGNSTMRFPKKNQTVKMYKDAACEEKLKVDFKGWGKQNKHCYKANWTDLSQARNVVSSRIWGDIIKTRANYAELPELMRTSPNLGVIDGFPVKVYADGVYQGRYTLNIPKDEWMANMDKDLDTHCILCGEGGTSALFREASMASWTDEIHDTVPASISARWIEVINFVMNSTDAEFKANLDSYIDVQSLLDYHLLGLAMCGMDGYAKNQLFMTWDGIKWYAQVYDMDATWGLSWNAYFVATDYPRSSYEDIRTGGNLLYIRLEEVFWNELRERWAELKAGALSMVNITNRFERFTDIMPEELVKEDYAETTANGAFKTIPLQGKNNVQQIRTYALARQKWVDNYLGRVAATAITLNKYALTFSDETPVTLVATVEPSDTTDTVVWTSTDETVAIVENGVVTPLHDGSCVIRATAGIVSASCAVTVSGIVVQYAVTNSLFGVTSSNANAAVGEGETYTATLTAKDGYTLEGASVTVTMGGVDITATAYSGGVITITNVTGAITIAVAAVDTSVAYSLATTVFDGTQSAIDTGIMLQDEAKDYTVFIDVEVGTSDTVKSGKVINAERSKSPWPGWVLNAQCYTEAGSTSSKLVFEGVTIFGWTQPVGERRAKIAIRYADGVMKYATSLNPVLTDISAGDYATAFSETVKLAETNFVGTIHSCKIWLEAKTDEECLAMVNS